MHDTFDYLVLAFVPLLAILVTITLFILSGNRKWRESIEARLAALEKQLSRILGALTGDPS